VSARVIQVRTPIDERTARGLRALDRVELSGTVYAARDAAHARIVEAILEGRELPFELDGACIYYVGPTPPPAGSGRALGSAGPTTSARMDTFMGPLLERGLRASIGKGPRSREAAELMVRHGHVYFGAVGGAGASGARAIRSAEVIAYEDLGAEAVRRLTVERLPLFVALDSLGQDAYELGRRAYLQGKSGPGGPGRAGPAGGRNSA
jgi:fumarate hydratase subunit beta